MQQYYFADVLFAAQTNLFAPQTSRKASELLSEDTSVLLPARPRLRRVRPHRMAVYWFSDVRGCEASIQKTCQSVFHRVMLYGRGATVGNGGCIPYGRMVVQRPEDVVPSLRSASPRGCASMHRWLRSSCPVTFRKKFICWFRLV